jgi:hypothetical protein
MGGEPVSVSEDGENLPVPVAPLTGDEPGRSFGHYRLTLPVTVALASPPDDSQALANCDTVLPSITLPFEAAPLPA